MSPRAEITAKQFESIGDAAEHIVELEDRLAKLEADLEYRDEKLRLFQRHLFLSSLSEKKPKTEIPEQESLFNEAESVSQVPEDEAQPDLIEVPAHTRKKNRGKPKRKPLPEDLPRKVIEVTIPENERVCPHDGKTLIEIGAEISEALDFIPAHLQVLRTLRKKYACPSQCAGAIKTAPVLPQPIPKSMASPGLLAHICVSKYLDSLPLYRQEAMFKRLHIDIPRSTMASWVIRCGELITPLINLLMDDLIASPYLHGDETKLQVLKEDGRKAEALSWMWIVAREGPHPIAVFVYEKTRSGSVPKRLLEGFQGYLQVDGYGGYNAVCAKGGIIRLGCMMHVRRKFHDAMLSSKKGKTGKKGRAFISELYRIEDECSKMSAEERKNYRDQHARPILDQFKNWIDQEIRTIPPKSIAGRALGYASREWEYITQYLRDGSLSIDNGFAENQIRPFAVGRKNWLFCDTEKGAEASANLYSLLITAKLNGLNPYEYLKDILARLPVCKTIEDFEKCLPTRWTSPLSSTG